MLCFVLFALQLSVCLWWHDYRRDGSPYPQICGGIHGPARHSSREEPFAQVIRKSKQKNIRIGTQNMTCMVDETYIWSWAEVSGETGEWTIGSIQHTENEQQRAKEAEVTLRIAIKEEQADIQNRNTNGEEAVEERRSKIRAELGVRLLQELERHAEGKKGNKGNKNIAEIRRGMLHSQPIGEQMRGAQELKADTAQKMKTMELTEEERQERVLAPILFLSAARGRHYSECRARLGIEAGGFRAVVANGLPGH